MRKFSREIPHLITLMSLLVLVVLVNACRDQEPDWIRINNSFILSMDEAVKVIDSRGNSLYVSLAWVEDDRCPSGTVCIQPGKAEVKVIIEDTRNSQFKTILCTGACSPSLNDIQSFTFYNREYVLRLLEVDPYPTPSNHGEAKKAGLKLYEN